VKFRVLVMVTNTPFCAQIRCRRWRSPSQHVYSRRANTWSRVVRTKQSRVSRKERMWRRKMVFAEDLYKSLVFRNIKFS
jgi:hypothetical protein